jgi:hypothetical protein
MKRHGWAVTAMWMAVSGACLGGQERLTVLLYDSVGMQTGEVDEAVELSRRFFQSVGVETSWTVCRSLKSCAIPPEGTYVRVSVVGWTKGTVMGFANMQAAAGGNPQVYVFHTRMSRLAAKTNNPLGRVMACVMAHEILHSLGLEHAAFGIMRETFGEKELAGFGHGPAMPGNQVAQLRSGVARLQPALVAAAQ